MEFVQVELGDMLLIMIYRSNEALKNHEETVAIHKTLRLESHHYPSEHHFDKKETCSTFLSPADEVTSVSRKAS